MFVILVSCESEVHKPIIEVNNQLKDISFSRLDCRYDASNGQHRVYALLKHNGNKRLKYLQMNAIYYDANGKEIARSLGGLKYELMPGDSDVVENIWLFPTPADLPTKIVLNATN
ncbi:FxLYD domain-containing protein [Mucilaginibacter sp. OK268]|uniref:FxLYD domain-containing protein n=1 Tax=Mucilaginibacter sp. OK268 TaxID=1881048 RepID=UPI00115FCD8C|nr:FxLYD domain-containing protein [Mucilaginibacter sp. OK268]